jgi:hypothetical protein
MGSVVLGYPSRRKKALGVAGRLVQAMLLFAPVLVLLSQVIAPQPMDLQFWPGAIVMMFIATLTRLPGGQQRAVRTVRRRFGPDGLSDLRPDALPVAAPRVEVISPARIVRQLAVPKPRRPQLRCAVYGKEIK